MTTILRLNMRIDCPKKSELSVDAATLQFARV